MAESNVVAEIDQAGMGKVYRVIVDGVIVWSHPAHIDGPLSDDAKRLFDALHARTGRAGEGGS